MNFSRTSSFGGGFAGFRGFANGFGNSFAAYARATGRYDAHSRRRALDRLDMLATMFDTAFILPGTNIRFGCESVLRLIPGIGDAVASALSCYLLFEAHRLGVPKLLFARMVANVVLEGTVGAVPIAGDAFDVYFRANRRNVALLREHFARVGY
ncbi:MAG TPA: DUF4112 domain-containing protein [Xanthobacteraceae bacterium]|jgi:hypothetical protein|nr:DUF4112 domain-containing protein [Xanthobacteraceae bacterium]